MSNYTIVRIGKGKVAHAAQVYEDGRIAQLQVITDDKVVNVAFKM